MTAHPASALRIILQTPAWTVQASVTAPSQPAPIEAWMPLLQSLASRAAQAAEDAAEAEGRTVSCAKGCGACCRQVVAISLVEARALAQLVAALPEPRQSVIRARFADGLARIAESGVLARDFADADGAPEAPLADNANQRRGAAWFGLGVACPFLEDESCSIHENRPLVCREYLVTSPASFCSRLYREPVDSLDLPVRISHALAHATKKIAGVSVAMVPLMMALQSTPDIDAALAKPRDMIEMLEVLLGEIGDWRIDR